MALATDITPVFFFSISHFEGVVVSSSCGLLSMAANRNDPSLSACRRVYISLENNNASSLNLRPLFKHWHTLRPRLLPLKELWIILARFYITSVINATATDHRFWLFIYFYSSRHYFFGGRKKPGCCADGILGCWVSSAISFRPFFFFFALMLRVTATGRPLHLIYGLGIYIWDCWVRCIYF